MKTITWNANTNETTETDDGLTNPSLTTDQLWLFLRNKRNALLQETDIYALSDITMSDEMKTYRQALRDLPANTSDPANPTFPTKPS
jgi:hypothetical protein|tara:strand:- start:45 stop:305 length:261 start_codon:yes stop_codon:yes gene_type:complete